MLSKSTLFTSVVSVASIVSAQSGESAASVSAAVSSAVAVLNFVDGFASALSAEPVAQISSFTNYVETVTTGSAFLAASSAVTVPTDVVASQEQSFLLNAVTATNIVQPSYVAGLPSSIQGPISSYYNEIASIIAVSGISPTVSMTSSGSVSPTGSPASGNSTSSSGTTAAPSKSSGSNTSASGSAPAKASNDAAGQHPGAFLAAAAGALGLAALL